MCSVASATNAKSLAAMSPVNKSDEEEATPPHSPPATPNSASESGEDSKAESAPKEQHQTKLSGPKSELRSIVHPKLAVKKNLMVADEEAEQSSPPGSDAEDEKKSASPLLNGSGRIMVGAAGAFRPLANNHNSISQKKLKPEAESSDSEERPLDFTAKSEADAADSRKRQLDEYFLPFKRLGINPQQAAAAVMMNQNPAALMMKLPVSAAPFAGATAPGFLPHPQPLHPGEQQRREDAESSDEEQPSRNKKRRGGGLNSFSIDNILSHRTAELKQQQQLVDQSQRLQQHLQQLQQHQAQQQSIVRPWDIGAVAAAAALAEKSKNELAFHQQSLLQQSREGASSTDSNSGGQAESRGADGGQGDRRKSVGDSPLDALFQMASKTFEGLKAKSGREHSRFLPMCNFDEFQCG